MIILNEMDIDTVNKTQAALQKRFIIANRGQNQQEIQAARERYQKFIKRRHRWEKASKRPPAPQVPANNNPPAPQVPANNNPPTPQVPANNNNPPAPQVPANNNNPPAPQVPANNNNNNNNPPPRKVYIRKKGFFDKTAQRGRIAGKKAMRFAGNHKVGVGLAGAGLLAAGAYGIHRYNQKKKEEAAAKQQTPQQQHTFLNKFGRI